MLLNSAFLFIISVSAVLAGRHRSRTLNRADHSTSLASENVVYTTNWAGAVWEASNGTFNFVTGSFTVPVLGGSSYYASASAWVGMDGDSCSGGILQAGVDMTSDGNGGSTYAAWYEWFPDYSYYTSGISVAAGHVIRVNVTALSTTTGIATIENLSNGQAQKVNLSSNYTLCGQNAEWIVEDYEGGDGKQVPFANFSTVTFFDAMAAGTGGTHTPDGATNFVMQQNGISLTSVHTNGSSVIVTYV